MPTADFSLLAIHDERLAALSLAAAPAWVWSTDGEHLLWANAAGCAFFGADNEAALIAKHFGPADPHRRQVKQLAPRLSSSGALRLERLRGFGAPLGGLMTCGCAKVSLRGTEGILIAAELPWTRVPAFSERVAALIESIEQPVIAFAEGRPLAANSAARMLGDLTSVAPRLLDSVREADIKQVSTSLDTPLGPATLHRAGSGAESALILLLPCAAVPAPVAAPAQPDKPVDAAPAPVAGTVANGDAAASRAAAGDKPAASGPAMPDDTPMDDSTAPETSSGVAPAAPSELLPLPDDPAVRRRHPLRFTWAMDAEGRFSLGSDEFTHLIGVQTTAAFSRKWSEVSTELTLDPEDHVAQAVATRATFSGILLHWPVDGVSGRLPVELSGLPVYGRDRTFAGYRGFGICRDLDGLTRLAAQRRHDALFGSTPATTPASETHEQPEAQEPVAIEAEMHEPPAHEPPTHEAEPETIEAIEAPANVVPFRPANDDGPTLALTPGETNAFQELARQLSARLESEVEQRRSALHAEEADDSSAEQPHDDAIFDTEEDATPNEVPTQLRRPVPSQNTSLIDRLPLGVLIYRADRLLHANAAFLAATGYASLAALNKDGGLGALYVGPGMADASTTDDGTPIKVSTLAMGEDNGRDARLHTIDWDGESALALILSPESTQPQAEPVAAVAPPPSEARIEADELATILETTAEGVVMFDGDGRVIACNRSAEALFSRDGTDLEGQNLIELFAPESQRAVLDYLEDIKSDAMESLFEQGRDVLGRAPDGGAMALSVTMGRTRPGRARYFAVFRDKPPPAFTAPAASPLRAAEQAKRADEKAASAKADLLARLSHEVRAPVSAIIGFADVMIEERFGALGNERYIDYMKDIRASGERVISIIDDMLDLSRIESGKLDLDFTPQDLNALVEQCVGMMQPQANRERIIIRSSLTHGLPNIEADTHALRQIALTLIGTAIHLANAGGQVIVSTALTDLGEVALRIRDTGQGMNDNEIAAAMAPFRTPSPADEVAAGNGANLSRAKALIEANRGRFHIKSAPNAGTLIEAVFSQAAAQAV